MTRATATRLAAAAAGLAFGLAGAELTFGGLRPAAEGAQPVLYSIEVRDDQGALLASPLLVGEAGQSVHLALSRDVGPHSPGVSESAVNMSLDLTPGASSGENLCLDYRLSIDDGFAHQGRIGVAYGERRSVDLRSGAGSLHLELVVARAHSKAFDRLLRARRRPAA